MDFDEEYVKRHGSAQGFTCFGVAKPKLKLQTAASLGPVLMEQKILQVNGFNTAHAGL